MTAAAKNTSSEVQRSRALFEIGGMHCASCVSSVELALREAPGVRAVRVNLTLTARILMSVSLPSAVTASWSTV